MPSRTKKTNQWEKADDEHILRMRIRDFALETKSSLVEPFIERLYSELSARSIGFHPPCYLADEWLCPDKTPLIGIPFSLAHQRLRDIEKKMIFELEGETEQEFMQFLRHECGHAINYAYRLYKRTRWRDLFGPFSARYSDNYYYRPYSRRYVLHLKDNYAQAHPDEDFAETFAVWLAPASDWQKRYAGWPVIKKLRYVDSLMDKIGAQQPVKTFSGRAPWSAARMTSTLAAYYQRRRRDLGTAFQGFYDQALREFFNADGKNPNLKASKFLQSHRKSLVSSISRWTAYRKYDIDQLVGTLINRCKVLDLYVSDSSPKNIIAVAVMLTTVAGKTIKFPKRRENL